MVTGMLLRWTVLLPIRAASTASHLMRLGESRGEEFEADHVAALCFGSAPLIGGLTGIHIAGNTLRHSGGRLAARGNYYAALRAHYAALPAAGMGHLRVEAISGFRALENTHPITPDRLRAAYIVNAPIPRLAEPPWPAHELLIPADETTAESVERELTNLLVE
jgi:hypothetical protein